GLSGLSKRSVRLFPAALSVILLTAAPSPARAAEAVHVVAKGQTLGLIAKRYHSTVSALREANNLRPGQQIHPGLELVIPGQHAEKAQKSKGGKRDEVKPVLSAPKRPGFVHMERGGEKLEIQLVSRHGRLTPGAVAGLGRILRFAPTGAKTSIDPRL